MLIQWISIIEAIAPRGDPGGFEVSISDATVGNRAVDDLSNAQLATEAKLRQTALSMRYALSGAG
jgi:hypothetical protein